MPVVFEGDDHVEVAEFFLGRLRQYHRPRGVVHVGAHRGEEVESYLEAGCERVALVEANPEHAAALRERFRGRDEVHVFEYAVSDEDRELVLNLHTSRSGSTEAASILSLKRFAEIVPTMHTEGEVAVEGIRLDALFERHGISFEDFDLLVIDVQGAELKVLRGATRLLRSAAAVLVEVAFVELYDGAPSDGDLRAFLASAGYVEVETGVHELYDETSRFPGWGEALFIRSELARVPQ